MTAKEFLSQAYRVDRMVNVKLERVRELHELATKASSTLTDMPRSPTRNIHSMEDIVVRIVDMKNEVLGDIRLLVTIKEKIVEAIKRLDSPDFRMLLELRYLCFKPWEEIATDMRYSKQRIFQLHTAALQKISVPKQD